MLNLVMKAREDEIHKEQQIRQSKTSRRRASITERTIKTKRYCKDLIPVLIFIGFSFGSAAILVELEGPVEKRYLESQAAIQATLERNRDEQLSGIFDALMCMHAWHGNVSAATTTTTAGIENVTRIYEEMTYLIETYVRKDAGADRNWTFIGALYFVFTVVTTIGCAQQPRAPSTRPHSGTPNGCR
jgi:hypothetical protein